MSRGSVSGTLHRVTVLFHAHDRLSGPLERFTSKFSKLGEKQREYEKRLREMGRTEEQIERIQKRAADSMQRIHAQQLQMQKTQMVHANNRQNMIDAHARREEKLRERQMDHWTKLQESQQGMYQAFADNRLVAQRDLDRKIEQMAERHNTNLQRIGERYESLGAQRQNIITKRNGNDQLFSPSERTHKQAIVQTFGSRLQRLRDRREAEMIRIQQSHRSNDEKIERMNDVSHSYDMLEAGLRRQVQITERELLLNDQLAEIERKRARAIEEYNDADERHQRKVQEATAEANRVLDEKNRKVRELHEAQMNGHWQNIRGLEDEVKVLEDKHRTQLTQLDEVRRQSQLIEDERKRKLVEQNQEIDDQHRKMLAQLDTERNLADEADRRARAAEKMQRNFDRMSNGVGNLTTGAVVAGASAISGHHFAKEGAAYDRDKRRLRMNLSSTPGVADKMIEAVENMNGRVPGSNVLMSEHEMVKLLIDQVSAAIPGEEALANLPEIAKVIRVALYHGQNTKTAGQDLSLIYERLGLKHLPEVQEFNDKFAQSAAISGRMNFTSLMNVLNKTSPIMRAAGMRPQDNLASFDWLIANFPGGGAQASTQLQGLLDSMFRGGTNKTSRAIITKLIEEGYLQGIKPRKATVDGKIVKDEKGEDISFTAVPTAKGQDLVQLFAAFRRISRIVAGVDPNKKELEGDERARLTQAQLSLVNNKNGGRLFQILNDDELWSRLLVDVEKANAAPGVNQQLQQMDKNYLHNLENFTAAWERFKVVGGNAIMPMAVGLLDGLTGTIMRMGDAFKSNPVLAQLAWGGGMIIGGILGVGGAVGLLRGAIGALAGVVAPFIGPTGWFAKFGGWIAQIAAKIAPLLGLGGGAAAAAAGGAAAGAAGKAAATAGTQAAGAKLATQLAQTGAIQAVPKAGLGAALGKVGLAGIPIIGNLLTVGMTMDAGAVGDGTMDAWRKQNPNGVPFNQQQTVNHTVTVKVESKGDGAANEKAAAQIATEVGRAIGATGTRSASVSVSPFIKPTR